MTDKPVVLLVEDDYMIAHPLGRRLASEGYKVVPVPDGASAVLAGKNTKPDLLLIDINLPLKDGFAVAQDLRQALGTIPIVFMTAARGAEYRRTSEAFENSWFLEKPFTTPFLIATMSRALATVSDA